MDTTSFTIIAAPKGIGGRWRHGQRQSPEGAAYDDGRPEENNPWSTTPFQGFAEAGPQQPPFRHRCEREVSPLLTRSERERARLLFERFFRDHSDDFETTLVHADLGPGHILCDGDSVVAVLDWSDARLGDPAIDFGWVLNGRSSAFAAAVLSGYAAAGGSVSSSLRDRALFYHRLGPWHEVLYGQETGKAELIASGLDGVRARLPDQ